MGLRENKDCMVRYSKQFEQTFWRKLAAFMDPVGGFDVIAFDAWIQTPEGRSTRDMVLEKYGDRAAAMLLDLIRGEVTA